MIVKPNLMWRLCHPVRYLLSRSGHWEWKHPFNTCPSGKRHCPHRYWVRDEEFSG